MKFSDLDQSMMSKVLYDTDFRKRLRNHDPEALNKLGINAENAGDITVKVVTCTADTTYISFPDLASDVMINDKALQRLQAGTGTLATAGTASTAGTFSCPVATVASIGSLGSVGTIDTD